MVATRWMWRSMGSFALGAAIACGGGAAQNQPQGTLSGASADDEATADLTENHGVHHHGGVTMFVATGLDCLGISSGQRAAVQRVQANLLSAMAPTRVAEQNLMLLIADGVAAGAIDHARVDAAVSEVASAAGGLHDATVDALDQLHAVLTLAQRVTLMDEVAARWAAWQRANAGDDRAGYRIRQARLAKLRREAGLTTSQVSTIQSSLGPPRPPSPFDPEEVDAHLRTFAIAFEGNDFDARTLLHEARASAHLAGWSAAQIAGFYEAVGPVLSPDQRSRVAQVLRDNVSHRVESTGG